jgi:large-conductance mechanosensitive channel
MNFSSEQLINLEDFNKYIMDNNIISVAVGVIIAYSAWDLIQSAVGDIILPGLHFAFLRHIFSTNEFVSSVFEPVNKLNIPRFTKQVLSFLIVLIITYLFIHNIVMQWTQDPTTHKSSPFIKSESEQKFHPGIQTRLSPSTFQK